MGDGTRVEASPKREEASSRLKCPALHQSLSEQNVALEQGGNYLISLMRTAAIVHRIPFPARTPISTPTSVTVITSFSRILAVSGLPKPPAGATIRRIDLIIRVDRNPAPAAD
jgi:hypothetical protein